MDARHTRRARVARLARRVAPLCAAAALSGCWKDELAELPPGILTFDPEVGGAPAGWVVEPIAVDLSCPDDTDAQFYLLYPESAVGAGPMPAVTLYHSGSFDFVFAPDPADPLAGTHYAEPSRLTTEWANRQAFATLGMYPDQDDEVHDGALPLAFAEQGIAVMLPTNCWGDLWHNAPGLADGDFSKDFFFRSGRASADWGYRFLVDPFFADLVGVTLPIEVDPTQTYAVGLGEGGRAVVELMNLTDANGQRTFSPAGILVDSPLDDVRFMFADPTVYGNTVAGLERIHQDGVTEAEAGSFHALQGLPTRTGYLYSSADPTLPAETFQASADRLAGGQQWLYTAGQPQHVMLNRADNIDLARSAVNFLTTGVVPPSF